MELRHNFAIIIAIIYIAPSHALLDNLVVSNLNDLYTSYVLTYSENDFKSVNFSSSILGGKALIGNALFVVTGKKIVKYLLKVYQNTLEIQLG